MAASEATYASAAALRGRIDRNVAMTCGRNFSERSQGYEIGLVVRFRDRAALDAYIPHPAHRGVVERYLHPIREAVVVVDYEI